MRLSYADRNGYNFAAQEKNDTGKMRRICILCQKGQHKAGDFFFFFSPYAFLFICADVSFVFEGR